MLDHLEELLNVTEQTPAQANALRCRKQGDEAWERGDCDMAIDLWQRAAELERTAQ